MRDEINESIARMSDLDREDVAMTCKLKSSTKAAIRKAAFEDEDVAEYVLQY